MKSKKNTLPLLSPNHHLSLERGKCSYSWPPHLKKWHNNWPDKAQAHQEQSEQLRAHSQSIDLLKQILQEALNEVKKKRSKQIGSTSQSKEKNHEDFDFDSSVCLHFSHEWEENDIQKDKFESYGKTDNQSKAELESKTNEDDVVQQLKRFEEQDAVLKTTSIWQEAGATWPYPAK